MAMRFKEFPNEQRRERMIRRREFGEEVLALVERSGLCVSDAVGVLVEISNALPQAAGTLPAKDIAGILEFYKGPCSEEQGM